MPRQRTGLRFEVFINGRRACISGIEGYGVLDVILTRVKRNPEAYPGKDKHPLKLSKAAWSREHIDVSVGGLDSTTDEYLHWLRRNLGIGDEIWIKLLPPGKCDSPKGNCRRLTAQSRGARASHRGR
jgi:hypothetical protein